MEEYINPYKYYDAFIKGFKGDFHINPYIFGNLEYDLWEEEYYLGVSAYRSLLTIKGYTPYVLIK